MTFLFRNISKIGRAILFRVLLFSSLITLLLSGIQLYIEFRNDFNQVNEIQQQIDSSYLKSVETAVWGINEKQAKALLEGIVALPTVTNAKIINEDGSNYVIQNETQAIHDLIYLKELYSPIEGKRQVIATLNVYQTHESAYINLKSRLFIVLVANFLKTFFVALFILSVFHQLVSKHLIYISDFLKNSHIFEDSKPLTLDRPKNSTTNNDELDILAKMFNQQGQALRSSWQELRNSETRYRELTEGSLQGILIVDKRWNYIYANKQLFNILKLKENDEKIKNLRQFFSSEVISILDVFFSKKQDKPVFKDEIELITADKSPAYVQAILMQTTHGEETYTQIVIFDISNFKMLKRKQKSIELQLIQKNKMAAIGTMLSGVTHEINNPNHLIKQNTLILKETWQAMSPHVVECLKGVSGRTYNNLSVDEIVCIIPQLIDDINEGSDRINNIVQDLRSFVRQDQNQQIELHNINDIIENTAHTLRTLINKRCNNFVLDLNDKLPKIWCFEQRLSQVFINFIINALEAISNSSQEVMVKTSFDEEFITVIIRDQGVGILSENRDRIFDAFFTTKIDSGGTGLGLAISHSILVQHHAEVRLNEKIKTGTEFVIKFPLSKKPMQNMSGLREGINLA